MYVVYGHRLFGKTDCIGKLMHVSTRFGHIYYLPLIPMGSYLIFSGTTQGVKVRFSFKSWMVVWARLFLGAFALSSVGIGIVLVNEPNSQGWGIGAILMGAAALIAFAATYFWKPIYQASYERAHALAEEVGLSDELKVQIDLLYGVISEDEANRALSVLRERREKAKATTVPESIPVADAPKR